MKYFIERLKSIPLWRIILAAALLFCMSFGNYSDLSVFGQPSFQEMTLSAFNNVTTFIFYIILLLLIADLGFKKEQTAEKENKDSFGRRLAYAALLCLMFAAVYMILSLFIMLFINGSVNFSDKWNAVTLYGIGRVSPSLAMVVSIALVFLRFVFLTTLVSAVNSRCKRVPYGYTAGFAVCLLDGIVYFHFSLFSPVGVFPFEHSFLESALGLTRNIPLDIGISVLYWLVLIAAVCMLYKSGKTKKPEKGV